MFKITEKNLNVGIFFPYIYVDQNYECYATDFHEISITCVSVSAAPTSYVLAFCFQLKC